LAAKDLDLRGLIIPINDQAYEAAVVAGDSTFAHGFLIAPMSPLERHSHGTRTATAVRGSATFRPTPGQAAISNLLAPKNAVHITIICPAADRFGKCQPR
jgi:hypothetical protein